MMNPEKPRKTTADLLVIGISPVLIMLLVGSLCFFLIEIFYRGEALGSVRWVMFWFVLAVVLVTRIGIEQGSTQAAAYGLFLALATWFYLVRIHPAFILGAILLGVVWWCAHKLTWDCTLIDEDEDASGGGLLETVYNRTGFKLFGKKFVTPVKSKSEPKIKEATPHAPGLWVVWFSVAALPLFGIGQMLLPRTDAEARHAGFVWLFVYITAAVGLLLTTSFLGLRRYLRQRWLAMPGAMAFGWIRFGGGLAALVLIGALLLPRPGALAAWQTLSYHLNYRLHQASEYAARFGPHGTGQGRVGNEPDNSAPDQNATDPNAIQKTPGQSPTTEEGKSQQSQDSPPHATPDPVHHIFQWLRALFILAVICLLGWLAFRNREVLAMMLRSLIAAIRKFFQDLFNRGLSADEAKAAAPPTRPKPQPFATFQNPFLTGKDTVWSAEQLVLYSYEALRAWAEERGLDPHPEMTAREFCATLGGQFPEITEDLQRLSSLYAHAAYGVSVPPHRDMEPLKQVWRFLRPV